MKVYYKKYRIVKNTLVARAPGFINLDEDTIVEVGSTSLPPKGRYFAEVKGLGIICVQGKDLIAIDDKVKIKDEKPAEYRTMHTVPDNYHM